jgi:hypothetical protein
MHMNQSAVSQTADWSQHEVAILCGKSRKGAPPFKLLVGRQSG